MCYYNFYPSEKGVEGLTDEGLLRCPSVQTAPGSLCNYGNGVFVFIG